MLRTNNFDFLRFLAASMVILGHSYHLLGQQDPLNILTSNKIGFAGSAVTIFFAISGYLISASWDNNANLAIFIKKRVLRIFPALMIAVPIITFIIGAFTTTLTTSEYFLHQQTYRYLLNAIFIINNTGLPEVYGNNASSIVNGSLWTLPVEFVMYMLVALLGIMQVLSRPAVPFFLLITLTILYWIQPFDIQIMSGSIPFYAAIRHAIAFVIGIIWYQKKTHIPSQWRIWIIAVIILSASIMLESKLLSTFGVSVLALLIAYSPVLKLHSFSKYGDFSYGMYIYAFPIQQTIIHYYNGEIAPLELFIISLTLSVSIGAISWHAIEKQALKFKP